MAKKNKLDFSEFDKTLDNVVKGFRGESHEVVGIVTTESETTAINMAEWTDRTSAARNSIFGVVAGESKSWTSDDGENGTIQAPESDHAKGFLGIGVSYGKYLETSNAGKYRIIKPVLNTANKKLAEASKNINLSKYGK